MKCPKCHTHCIPSRDDPEQMFCPVDGMVPTSEPELALHADCGQCPNCGTTCRPSFADETVALCPNCDWLSEPGRWTPTPSRRARIGVDMEVETAPGVERVGFWACRGYMEYEQEEDAHLTTPAVLLLSAEEIITQLARAYGFDPDEVPGLTVTVEPPGEGSDQFAFTVQGE